MIRATLTFAFLSGFAIAHGDDKKDDISKAEPESTPLELTLSAKATKFTLNTGGLSAADYKKKLEDAAKGGKPVFAPMVNLMFEIKNTSDKPVKVWTSGDPVVMTVTVKGKGALNLDPQLAFTDEFRLPKSTEIAAGKNHTNGIITLMSGFRGRAHYSYWTEPGEYEIVATLKTAMLPAPKGAKEGMDGYGIVTLTSAPFKVIVEEKK